MHKYKVGDFVNEYGESYVVLFSSESEKFYLLGDETSWEIYTLRDEKDYKVQILPDTVEVGEGDSFLLSLDEFEKLQVITKSWLKKYEKIKKNKK